MVSRLYSMPSWHVSKELCKAAPPIGINKVLVGTHSDKRHVKQERPVERLQGGVVQDKVESALSAKVFGLRPFRVLQRYQILEAFLQG
eukprot:scaffold735_cov376-Prasinococcus_capsulatus_cf.AAC.18